MLAVFACAFLGLAAPGSALAAGSISGTVTDEAAGHAPIENVRVCAFLEGEEGFERGEEELGVECELTDPSGDYTVSGLVEGQYVVEFWPNFEGVNYSYEYYDDQLNPFEADPVEVTTGAVENIDAELTEGGEIRGKVFNGSGGAPLSGIFVCAEASESPWYTDCQITDATGEYVLAGLPEGEYWLEFLPFNQNFLPQFRSEIPVTTGGLTTENASLQPGASIAGTVTDAVTHLGLAEIYVCAIEVVEEEIFECEESGPGGSYTLGRLPAATYKVVFAPFSDEEFGPEGLYRTQFYNGQSTFAAATPIALAAGATRSAINAALVKKKAAVAPLVPPPVVVPILSTPAHKSSHCKKGFHKKKVKGRARCVRVRKKHHHKKHHGTPQRQRAIDRLR